MTDIKTRIAALIISLTLAVTGTLTGCGSRKPDDSAADSSSTETTADTSSAADSIPEIDVSTGEVKTTDSETDSSSDLETKTGSPWNTSVETGCLPPAKPDLCDDLYTYYNYDFLSQHQDEYYSVSDEHIGELSSAVIDVINDTSKKSHDLEQMRIFYDQALDIEGRKGKGNADIQPYLDKIDSAKSIKELNSVLTADDFPFSPFLLGFIAVTDTRDKNRVELMPNLLVVDPVFSGGEYYNNLDDDESSEMLENLADQAAIGLVPDFRSLGMEYGEAYYAVTELAEFEKNYGRFVDYDGKYENEDYGVEAAAISEGTFAADELYKLSPVFPLKELIKKIGKDGSEKYYIGDKNWLTALNDAWTDENLDMLKLMAKAKILDETRTYRDPTEYFAMLELCGLMLPTDSEYAFAACDSRDTFSQGIGKIYVEDCLGQKAVDRLTDITKQILSAYKKLIGETEWLGEESRAAMTEKLDKMTLNILQPEDGYMDYSGLELVPTDKGGTLFGNYLLLKQYRQDQEKKMIGKPASSTCDWYAIPPTADNVFVDATSNSISVMPGYISELIYTDEKTDSELMSGFGFAVAHEISHAFDFKGSQFDANGQPNAVFSGDDVDKFLSKTLRVSEYYSTIQITDGQHIDGQRVVREAAADISGMQVILEILKEQDTDYNEFFKNFAYMWAEVLPEGYAVHMATDVHPLSNLRVNVCAQMSSELYDKLGVKEGDDMYLAPNERIVFWGKGAS